MFKKLFENKNLFLKKENLISISIVIFAFLIDRFTKNLVLNDYTDNTFYLNDFLNLDLTWNTGIGFGLFKSNSPLIYNLISFFIGAVLIFLFYITCKSNKLDKFIFSTIIGGALGNFYDRVFFKAVPDFIDLHYGNFHWFVFNVADIFITIGIIAFIIGGFLVKNTK